MFSALRAVVTAGLVLGIASGCAGGGWGSNALVLRPYARSSVRHDSAQFMVLHSFLRGTDGALPLSGPTMFNGTLYGATNYGGTRSRVCGCGVIYAIDGSGSERVVYRFRGRNAKNLPESDGAHPQSSLVAFNGKLYGTTSAGGDLDPYSKCGLGYTPYGCGTIFYLDDAGKAHVAYRFQGGTDGMEPTGNLVVFNNKLYGTTSGGGDLRGSSPCVCGTIFSFNSFGKEKIVHRFNGTSDGANPQAGLSVVNGKLYGTAPKGGSSKSCENCGTVFSLDKLGTFQTIYTFDSNYAGEQPESTIVQVGKTLYGTAYSGGNRGLCGTIFAIAASGERTAWTFSCGKNGANPGGPLVVLNGIVYGTTRYGGSDGCRFKRGCGSVFAFDPSTEQEAPIYGLRSADGNDPLGLTLANGVLYGAAYKGGAKGDGTVFSVTP